MKVYSTSVPGAVGWVDGLFCWEEQMRNIIAVANERAMFLRRDSGGIVEIFDGVFNHTGRGFFAFHDILENGAESPWLDWYHINPDWLAKGKPIDGYPSPNKRSKDSVDTFSRLWISLMVESSNASKTQHR
jgi:hypothetical protein